MRFAFFLLHLPVLVLASETLLLEPTETNRIYGMDHGAALLLDVYQPKEANGHGIVFIMGTGFTAQGEYEDRPLKDLDRYLVTTGIFPNLMGERRQVFASFVEAGFTVFSINHRLAPAHTWEVQVRDCQRAVQYLRHHADSWGIDPETLTAMGHSSGATMASLLGVLDEVAEPDAIDPVARASGKVARVIAMAGVYDVPMAYANAAAVRPILAGAVGRVITYQPPGHPVFAAYARMSALSHLDPGDARFYLLHGMEDDVVPPQQSERFAGGLRDAGLLVAYDPVPETNHGSVADPETQQPLRAVVQWLWEDLDGPVSPVRSP